MAQADGEDTREESSLGYGEKIDAMREEIKQMRQSLDAVLVKSKDNSEAEKTLDDAQKTKRGDTDSVFSSRVTPRTLSPMNSTSARLNPARRIGGRDTNTRLALTREDSPSPASDYDQQYGPETLEEPMGSLYEVTRLRNIRSNQANTPPSVSTDNIKLNDFISRGVVSEEKAEDLYNTFHKTLNHYLWVGLEQVHPSWTSVRKSSELLAATILTVTALHLPMSSDIFDACYNEFLSLVSSSMFSRYHSVDDVRGLCISAFWLSEHSWKLTGHAIRIATELGIHQSFPYALEGDREHFLRARLWYMLYVCDRHFSIAYGRPPSVGETTQIREYDLFLSSHLSSVLDTRILSQVSLMQILTQVYERFSERPLPTMESVRAAGFGKAPSTTAPDSRVERPSAMLSDSDFDTLRSFNVEVDHWRMRWYPRQPPSPFIGQFTSKGVILYSYFAKLQINALAIRGVSINSDKLSTERKEFANMAISAASSILTLVQEEDDLRKALVGTPLYVHTMIAFASVFLMKVASRWDGIMGLNIEYANVSRLLEKMVIVLKEAVTSERHMLKHIGQGLEKMLGRMREARKQDTSRQVSAHGSSGAGASPDPFAWHITSGNQVGIEDESVKGLQNSKSTRTIFDGTHSTTQVWDPNSYPGQQSIAESELGMFGDNLTGMNETFMYEAFGTGSAGDVYNMLSSQFQY
ncbi:C6 transcription factor [Colletotrichum karsti]|uniref:C6 transcription factor n=1 Tax=Colletotrichum karsti TaxID=1095194 RepID=A0A9P6I9W1_9PEZI|nr:C6 transcription factor [Colletotrichum karsti]KAF9878437.1 C6 transcription factor [Colletotrichum karsti]